MLREDSTLSSEQPRYAHMRRTIVIVLVLSSKIPSFAEIRLSTAQSHSFTSGQGPAMYLAQRGESPSWYVVVGLKLACKLSAVLRRSRNIGVDLILRIKFSALATQAPSEVLPMYPAAELCRVNNAKKDARDGLQLTIRTSCILGYSLGSGGRCTFLFRSWS